MKKQSLTIEYYIDKEIKKGDKVKFIDGSGMSNHNFPDETFYIVFSYPKVLKTESIIKDLEFEVVETGITNKGCSGAFPKIYIQDIAVSYNGVVFHTPSNFVTKLNQQD